MSDTDQAMKDENLEEIRQRTTAQSVAAHRQKGRLKNEPEGDRDEVETCRRDNCEP